MSDSGAVLRKNVIRSAVSLQHQRAMTHPFLVHDGECMYHSSFGPFAFFAVHGGIGPLVRFASFHASFLFRIAASSSSVNMCEPRLVCQGYDIHT